MGGLSSLMAVIAPAFGAPLLGLVSHYPAGRLAHRRADVLLRRTAGLCLAAGRLALPARGAASTPRFGRTRGRAGTDRSLNTMHDKILILDFGSQVTQLIARRVRESHVYCEIHPNDVSDAFIRDFAPKGIILSGSHASTYEAHDLRAPQAVWDLGVPVLGICYGMFTLVVQQGGQVEASAHREFGYAEVRAHGHTKLLQGIQDFATPQGHGMLKVWMSHGDKVTALPPGFKLMASTPSCPIAGIADEARGYYAVQFHPEVTHTVQGAALLGRFVHDICGARATGSCATTSPRRWR
jgi:GMP synthase (glutamine-hydrolysing) A subunit